MDVQFPPTAIWGPTLESVTRNVALFALLLRKTGLLTRDKGNTLSPDRETQQELDEAYKLVICTSSCYRIWAVTVIQIASPFDQADLS